MRGPHLLVAGILFSLFGALGCAQGVGDRCVQNSDCASGTCSSTSPQGGTCTPSTGVVTTGTGGSLGTGGAAGGGGTAGAGGAAGSGAGGQDAAAPTDASGLGGAAGHDAASTDAQTDAPADR